MRKQDAATLKLFVSGLESRWRENRDYFNGIQFVLSSGRKRFEGRVTRADGDLLRVSFGGQKQELDFADFTTFYVAQALHYDTAVLEYLERGATIIVEADERGVRTRQTDTKRTEEIVSSAVLPDRDYLI